MKSKATESKKGANLKFIGRAFRSRNYRLFFLGQGVSLIGTWMQQIAMGWLVYRMTNSAFAGSYWVCRANPRLFCCILCRSFCRQGESP